MRRQPGFRERLQQGVVLADGAMGTYLHRLGVPIDRCFPYECLTSPDLVERIHREYADAGAEILKTNTYGAHRMWLERYGLGDEVRRINIHACRLARQASERRCYIAGSVGPLGSTLAPLGEIRPDDALEVFAEQIAALQEGGADLILIETISDLQEFEVALRAARQSTELPVVIEKTFTEDGTTLMGELPNEVVACALEGGADAVGANCTVGPQRMLDIIERMAQASELPLSAMPTAGLPRLVDGRVDYHAEPEYMGRYARRLAEAGASIVGACCGSTPEHIAAMRRELDRKPLAVRKRTVRVEATAEIGREPVPLAERSRLGARLGRELVVSVELELPRTHDLEPTLRRASRLARANVDAFVLADALQARLFVHPMVVAQHLRKHLDLECVLAYASRDKNVLGIQSELLAAHVMGIRNVLVATADAANFGDYPTATTLYDVGTTGLVRILDAMNHGLDLACNPIGDPTAFVPLVQADVGEEGAEEQLRRLEAQVAAGAAGIVTRPVFSSDLLDQFLESVRGLGVPVIVGILPLRSAAHAEYLHNEVPGIDIPESVRQRLREVPDPASWGEAAARELLHSLPGRAAGVHVIPPYRQEERVIRVLEALELSSLPRMAARSC